MLLAFLYIIGFMKSLGKEFFARDTLRVAKELLGKKIVRKINGKKIEGIISEVEAYHGPNDKASHASRGRNRSYVWRGWRHLCLFDIWNVLLLEYSDWRERFPSRRFDSRNFLRQRTRKRPRESRAIFEYRQVS